MQKNYAIVMVASNQFLVDYLLKSPTNDEGDHLEDSSLEMVLDKYTTFVSPNQRTKCLSSRR